MDSSRETDRPPKQSSSGLLSGMGGSQKYIDIGLQAGGSVAVYTILGLLLDKWLDTFPWLMIVGIFVGIAGMFAIFVKIANELNNAGRKEKTHE